ncbi:MAG: hypothetical protein KDA80_03580 [Planctomycetaceae bacterium]|nr:hypothetical protein [Planctomycetaceae bacterium]
MKTASQDRSKWLGALAVLTTCSLVMSMNEADPDLWGHLQYGREILSTGELPKTATWTFTAEGYRWINHENFAELAMAAAYDKFGHWGLTLGKYILGLFVIGLSYWSARRQNVPPITIGAMCLVAAYAIEFHWHFRPQVLGYGCFAVLCFLLKQAVDRLSSSAAHPVGIRDLAPLLGTIPLMAFWANSHGSFAAGLAVGMSVLGMLALQLMLGPVLTLFPQASGLRSNRWALVSGLVTVGFLALAATFGNPYGIQLHLWLWDALHVPRPEIRDWEGISLVSLDRQALMFLVITSSLVAVAARSRRPSWPLLITALLIATQAYSHIRHLPLLAILWLSWFPKSLEDLRSRVTAHFRESVPKTARPISTRRRSWQPIFLAAWIAVVGVLTWPRIAQLRVDGTRFPVDAVRFLVDQRLEGNTLVTFNWAQYAIGVFAHEEMESRVAFDGRFRTCYPQSVIDRHFDFLFGSDYDGPRYRSPESGPIDPIATLEVDQPDFVLISRKQRPSIRIMESVTDDWDLLYQDGLAQIWARKDKEPRRRSVETDEIATSIAAFPAFPSTSRTLRDRRVATTENRFTSPQKER